MLHVCGNGIFSSRFIVLERTETCLSSLAVFLCYVNSENCKFCKICRSALVGEICITKKCTFCKIRKPLDLHKIVNFATTYRKIAEGANFLYLVEFNEKSQNLLNSKLKRKIVKCSEFVTAFNPGHKSNQPWRV